MKYFVFTAINKNNPDDVLKYFYNEGISPKTKLDKVFSIARESIKRNMKRRNRNIDDYTFTKKLVEYKDISVRINTYIFIQPDNYEVMRKYNNEPHRKCSDIKAREEYDSLNHK